MFRRSAALAAVCCTAVLFLSGCPSRVNFEKTATLEPGDIKMYTIDAPRGEQKVRVQVQSAAPVDVAVGLEADRDRIQKLLEGGVAGAPAGAPLLARKTGATEDTLVATIPAGKAFTVFVGGARKKTDVKLSVTSQ